MLLFENNPVCQYFIVGINKTRVIQILGVGFFFKREFQLMMSASNDYVLYHQTKTPIDFWYRRGPRIFYSTIRDFTS